MKPLIDPRHFTLETAPEAHNYITSGKVRGKVLVDIH
ncbi:hypothetical protein CHELA17_40118 [Chelatococcus asaccharovorans]|nr:hypothetical protein CHELA17_40118 [Chelatococcus asaccharovorans]